MMNVIKKTELDGVPFEWLNLDSIPLSNCEKVELDLLDPKDKVTEMGILFFTLFDKFKDDLIIGNEIWGYFCIDNWDINSDQYNNDTVSLETHDYLKLLEASAIELSYAGLCSCNNWDLFLKIILSCITSHVAPYSPLFYNKSYQFVFYFHHSGSIGLLYKEKNSTIDEILKIALRHNLELNFSLSPGNASKLVMGL